MVEKIKYYGINMIIFHIYIYIYNSNKIFFTNFFKIFFSSSFPFLFYIIYVSQLPFLLNIMFFNKLHHIFIQLSFFLVSILYHVFFMFSSLVYHFYLHHVSQLVASSCLFNYIFFLNHVFQ